MMLLIVTLLLAGVVACDLAMEMNILSSTSEYLLRSNVGEPGNYTNDTEGSNDASEEPSCSPKMVNLSQIEYHSNHRYYTFLKEDVGYAYCLPISGRKDSPFCTGADRMDLLTQHSTQTRCYASVLHMLLVEVLPIAPDYSVPYLDLYGMKKLNETDWSLEKYGDSTLPAEKVESFSQVTINGLPFDTVHDPDYFLKETYGDDYMIPKPRK
ncbi:hypothetical protein JG688_00015032 [Phytophthora aleatoria]|uniref:Uncharacterized protein n=1 Tax=Phytophthora aleatoria TaxID=2496075 RepID=A0A8J5I6N0_9STRA|nr:hypothetical protein JG688_00015032 [Phytophthora aleatoria]